MGIHTFKGAFLSIIIFIVIMILFPAVISFTAEYPDPLLKHYIDHQNVYWKINQISISPIFDEPETTQVELYFQKPHTLYLLSAKQQVYAKNDTVWTYLIKYKQIQKATGQSMFNPFDYIDTTRSVYKAVDASANQVVLKSSDGTMEPDSLTIDFAKDGRIVKLVYLDANENRVEMIFLDESFSRKIPSDNFLINKPLDVEIIDLDD